MGFHKLLLVDDDVTVLETLSVILGKNDFEVTVASNAQEALKRISERSFDVLLSDLHMPNAGDGLTVVSAMRHANPTAVTLLLSAFPEMGAATQAILLQTDEILVKPMSVQALIDTIRQRIALGPSRTRVVESVAAILERSRDQTIQHWYGMVQLEPTLMAVPLSFEVRTAYLKQVFRDLGERLRSSSALGTKEFLSPAAKAHGYTRRQQGYTAAMMVQESRMLQVSIFNTLQMNLSSIDFSVVLLGVMTIADEVDSQLSQAMDSYTRPWLAI
jgi:YesN/AraC family two-component response regulator